MNRLADVGARERLAARDQLVQHDSQTEEIGAVIDRFAERLFRAHMSGRADNLAAARLTQIRSLSDIVVPDALGQTEIEHLHAAFAEDDIRRLDVAVNDPFGVSRIEGIRRLNADVDHLADLEGTLTHQGIQRLAFHEFHGDEQVPVWRLSDFIDDTDVWMIQGRGRLGFLDEPLPPRSIVRHFEGQDFQGDFAIERRIFRQIDLAHPARPQFGGDPVVPDGCVDQSIVLIKLAVDSSESWGMSSPVVFVERGIATTRSVDVRGRLSRIGQSGRRGEYLSHGHAVILHHRHRIAATRNELSG